MTVGLLGLVVLILLLLSVVFFPYVLTTRSSKTDLKSLTAAERIAAVNSLDQTRNSVRTTLVQAIGGGLVLVSGSVAWAQVQATRRGQVTDRLTKSVDQLGSERREVRLGGIYALNQVAENPQYTRAVADVLLAYLKSRSSSGASELGWASRDRIFDDLSALDKGDLSPKQTTALQIAIDAYTGAMLSTPTSVELLEPTIWADLQAVLSILVLDMLWVRAEAGRLDLSSIHVPFATLNGAILNGSSLARASLPFADLQGAHLDKADLTGIHLEGANLYNAYLSGSDLQGSNFTGANLKSSTLNDVQAKGANFVDAYLEGSHLVHGDFEKADFSNAHLNSAHLNSAILPNAIFDGADLNSAILQQAILRGADLSRATLYGADFRGADLTGVTLAGVKVDSKTCWDNIEADGAVRGEIARLTVGRSGSTVD